MPELLRSAKLAIEKGQSQGRDVSYLKFLTDSIIPALVEALHKVFTVEFISFGFNNLIIMSFLLRLQIIFNIRIN